jgi:prepilin-type N-terminal cleavage/methylation domain-containing protein
MKNQGFTLMETVMYLALFGILMSGAIVGVYNLLEGKDRNVVSSLVQEEGVFINRKINWALTGSTTVNVSGGGSILTITRPDLGVQSPLIFKGTANAMTLARGTGAAVQLNSEKFPINNVVFTYQASVNGRPPSISIGFLVQNKSFTFRNYIRQ